MIEGVLQVSDMRVRDVMLPRSQMEVVDKNAKPSEFLPSIIKLGHSRYPVIGDVRGKGLMIGIELIEDPRLKTPAPKKTQQFILECLKSGVVIISAGKSTVRLCPPLIIDRKTIDVALEIMDKVFQQI